MMKNHLENININIPTDLAFFVLLIYSIDNIEINIQFR